MRDVAWRLASKQFSLLGLRGNRDCLRGLPGVGGTVCVWGVNVVFLWRGAAEEEEGEVPRGAVLMAVACSPDRASEKPGWALSQSRACQPVLSREVSVDAGAWAVLPQLTHDVTLPTEAL